MAAKQTRLMIRVKALLQSIWQLSADHGRKLTAQKHHVSPMALSFPNASRSYDVSRQAVRFWGYDSAMETSFFVTEDALKRIQPGTAFDPLSALRVFDVNRPLIYATAAKVYARGHRGSYNLVSSDF